MHGISHHSSLSLLPLSLSTRQYLHSQWILASCCELWTQKIMFGCSFLARVALARLIHFSLINWFFFCWLSGLHPPVSVTVVERNIVFSNSPRAHKFKSLLWSFFLSSFLSSAGEKLFFAQTLSLLVPWRDIFDSFEEKLWREGEKFPALRAWGVERDGSIIHFRLLYFLEAHVNNSLGTQQHGRWSCPWSYHNILQWSDSFSSICSFIMNLSLRCLFWLKKEQAEWNSVKFRNSQNALKFSLNSPLARLSKHREVILSGIIAISPHWGVFSATRLMSKLQKM